MLWYKTSCQIIQEPKINLTLVGLHVQIIIPEVDSHTHFFVPKVWPPNLIFNLREGLPVESLLTVSDEKLVVMPP